MICTSVANLNAETCIQAISSLPMAEIRLDMMDISLQEVASVFLSHPNLIATYRPRDGLAVKRRMEFFEQAILSGAAYIDLQLQWPQGPMAQLMDLAHEHGCKVIVSYHDFDATAGRDELVQIRKRCFDTGADLAKIACMVNEPADNARLLGLLDTASSTVVVGMGPKGLITRLAAPMLGAPFTYASLKEGSKTAPGQVDTLTLQLWIDALESKAEERG